MDSSPSSVLPVAVTVPISAAKLPKETVASAAATTKVLMVFMVKFLLIDCLGEGGAPSMRRMLAVDLNDE